MFSNFIGGGRGSQASSSRDVSKDGESIDTVLSTPGLKVDFVLLVMLLIDRMRVELDAVFDPSITSSPSPAPPAPSPWAHGERMAELPPSYGQATQQLSHDDYIRRKRELGAPKSTEIHNAASQSLNKWRIQVLKRLGQVLNVSADAALAEKRKQEAMGSSHDLIQLDDEDDTSKQLHSRRLYPSIKTQVATFSEEQRILLLNSLLLILLSLEHYNAYSRVLMCGVASSLSLKPNLVTQQEDTIAHGLLVGAKAQMNAEESRKRENNKSAADRAWKVGLATVAGAALIGVTGGLAAPFLAGAVGTVLGGIGLGGTAIAGLLGTLAGNVVLIGGLFGAYGGKMTGKMMDKYAKEVDDFQFIPLRQIQEDDHRLRVVVGISGWLSSSEERYLPWLVLGDRIEGFALQWELDVLMQLGGSISETVRQLAFRYAAIEVIKRTVFAGLLVTLWPLGLLKLGKILSNSFSVAQARADKAGEVMADALIHKAQGERPVTLIGYSLGSRVIYSCLRTLARRKAFGLVETVVLMGSPVSAESQNWRPVRAVVADRVVNVYSRNDYVLGLVYRTSSITPDVAGLQPVDEIAGIENVDVSDLVSGHLRYRYLTGTILERIGFEALDQEQLDREKDTLKRLDAQEEQMKLEQEAKKQKRKKPSASLDWDAMIEGDQEAYSLDDKEMARRLQKLKVKEEQEGEASDAQQEPRAERLSPPLKSEAVPPADDVQREVLWEAEEVKSPVRPAALHRSSSTTSSTKAKNYEDDYEDDEGDEDDGDDGGNGHRITMIDTEDV